MPLLMLALLNYAVDVYMLLRSCAPPAAAICRIRAAAAADYYARCRQRHAADACCYVAFSFRRAASAMLRLITPLDVAMLLMLLARRCHASGAMLL